MVDALCAAYFLDGLCAAGRAGVEDCAGDHSGRGLVGERADSVGTTGWEGERDGGYVSDLGRFAWAVAGG